MPRSLIQFYALTVCLATLMCLVVALGLGLYDLVRIAAPGFTLQEHMVWLSDENYLTYYPDKKSLPAKELAAHREQYRQNAITSERHSAQQRAVFIGIILAIDVVVYALHWRIANRLAPAVT
jgi:hypothetical protein